jgi:hypothetical protein
MKPGYLTVQYLEGKRASYVQPFKMFLVVSLIYFLIGSIEMPQLLKSKGTEEEKTESTRSSDGSQVITGQNEVNISIKDKAYQFAPPDTLRKYIGKYGIDVYVRYNYPTAGPFARYLIKKAMRIYLGEKSFDEVLLHNASRLIFLLIPFAAFLFKILYLRRRRFYYDHLIFSLHFHTVVFMLFIVFQLIAVLYEVPLLIQLGLILLYLFFGMKKLYGQRGLPTFGKLLLFLLMYLIMALPLFFILLTSVSLATY